MFIFNSHPDSLLGLKSHRKFLQRQKDAFFSLPLLLTQAALAQINISTFLIKEWKILVVIRKTLPELCILWWWQLEKSRVCHVWPLCACKCSCWLMLDMIVCVLPRTSDMSWNVHRKFAFPVKGKKKITLLYLCLYFPKRVQPSRYQ